VQRLERKWKDHPCGKEEVCNRGGGTRQPAIGFQGCQDFKGVWFYSHFRR
jgi:hypothetical protein